jgi:DNA polymerase-3 subunit epsilon
MPKVSALHAFGTGHRVRHPFEGKTDTRRRRKLKDVARTLPRTPGVYFFYGFNDRLLYIGKAKCLRERVRSYFAETSTRRPPKLRRLLAEIKRLEWQECGSELEALLVERRLIAERLPILNRQHKRFVVYPYLLLSDEAFPRFTLTRAEPIDEANVEGAKRDLSLPVQTFDHLPIERAPHVGELPGLYLGPFTSPRVASYTFEAMRMLFPLRSCEGTIRPDAEGRACFYHEIGRCCGPCVGTTGQDEYSNLCNDLLALLQMGQAPQLDALRARMQRLSDEWRFEEAAQLREQLVAIEAVATRLQRLQRMRREHNVVIVQPTTDGAVSTLLVQSGVVRRNLIVRDWATDATLLKRAAQECIPRRRKSGRSPRKPSWTR